MSLFKKKWLVKLVYEGDIHNDIYIIKAKNSKEVEQFINRWIIKAIGADSLIGYEYEEMPRKIGSFREQSRSGIPQFMMCGSWIGADYMLEIMRKDEKQ